MGFERSVAVTGVADLQQRLADNLLRISRETGEREFAVPVALFLVVDEENGGDVTARELVKRFRLLDVESRDAIDFFFLGWRKSEKEAGGVEFSLAAFEKCRDAMRRVGIGQFGGNADLFVLDAWLRNGRVELDFEHTIHVDLSAAVANRSIPALGGFLQGLIDTTEEVRRAGTMSGSAIRISDQLGLASASRSFIDFILDKWGKGIGATSLKHLAVKRIGPRVDLARL